MAKPGPRPKPARDQFERVAVSLAPAVFAKLETIERAMMAEDPLLRSRSAVIARLIVEEDKRRAKRRS